MFRGTQNLVSKIVFFREKQVLERSLRVVVTLFVSLQRGEERDYSSNEGAFYMYLGWHGAIHYVSCCRSGVTNWRMKSEIVSGDHIDVTADIVNVCE